MAKLVVIAKVISVDGKSEQTKQELKKLITPTLNESGCIQYDLHQDNTDPNLFYFYEIWESMNHLQAHGASKHIQTMRTNTKDCVVERSLNFLSKVE